MSRYLLNKLVHEIQFPEGRARFDSDPKAFLDGYDLTEDEVVAVRGGDVRTLWTMGVNPYLLRVYQLWKKISDDDFRAQLAEFPYPDSEGRGDDLG